MKRSIRIAAVAMGVMFALLAGNLTYIQAYDPDNLANHPLNPRGRLERYGIKRGSILAGSGAAQIEIARSVAQDSKLKYRREYPAGPLYATVTGYLSPSLGSSGLEGRFDDALQGTETKTIQRLISDFLNESDRRGDNLITTIEPAVQQRAFDALGDQKGAVVALNPKTGDVLAMVSKPTWDPNVLVANDGKAVQAAWDQLNEDPNNPRLNRATSELYPPGSTFKVITAATFIEQGGSLDAMFKDPASVLLPGSQARIRNSGRTHCGDGNQVSLRQALIASCNTVFAEMVIDSGPTPLVVQAEKFGFNRELPFDTQTATPVMPQTTDPAQGAQSAIGQFDVRSSPLHMAMVAGTIANDGVTMTPRLVKAITDQAGRTVSSFQPQPLMDQGRVSAQAISATTANTLTEGMVEVVNAGTGRKAKIKGINVAGKTGTAQRGANQPPHAWFIAFAPAEDPKVAVAVIVEGGGAAGDEATGGSVAAPIAKQVMETALGM